MLLMGCSIVIAFNYCPMMFCYGQSLFLMFTLSVLVCVVKHLILVNKETQCDPHQIERPNDHYIC